MELDNSSSVHTLQRVNNNTECCNCLSLASRVTR